MKEILRFEQVSYEYEGGSTQPALSNCCLRIQTGEKIAVLGNNGAGKSTFFLLANGVLKPKSGKVFFGDVAVSYTAKELNKLRRGVGLVFQDPDVQILAGTVEEEISFGPMNLDLPLAEVEQRVDQAIDCLQLDDYRQRAPQYLSSGEKKRVAIADVLAMAPQLMLLDEPTSSLDPAGRRLLEENLDKLHAKGIALAVATHDVDFAWRWAQRVLVFSGGQLVADDTPEQVFSNEALLRQCHLEQPTLYQVGLALGITPPHTIKQLQQAQNRL